MGGAIFLELFLRENKLLVPMSTKRKYSPEETTINKLRRMVISTSSSPAPRKRRKATRRTASVSGNGEIIRQRSFPLDQRLATIMSAVG